MTSIPVTLQENDRAVGVYVQSPNPEAVEMIGWIGFDFVIIDMEHGAISEDTARLLIRTADAAGIPCMIRIPSLDDTLIAHLMDAGAAGIVVPDVRKAEDAARAVAATRYAPAGVRGACPLVRSVGYAVPDWSNRWSDIAASANSNALVWIIVETRDGVANFEDIVAVSGVSAVAIGRFDLAQSMGLAGNVDHPDVRATVDRLAQMTHEAGHDTIATALQPDLDRMITELRKREHSGSRILVAGSDRQIMGAALEKLRLAVAAFPGRGPLPTQ